MVKRINKPSRSQNTAPKLTLVVSNPAPVPKAHAPSSFTSLNPEFTAKVQKRGDQLYEMNIQAPFHDLRCDLILEIEREGSETTVVCHFPNILSESNKFLDEDESLYGIIAVQFQMKVLEQLFLFCTSHDASQLTIYMDDDQAEGFGILQNFLIHCEETLTENGEKTEMVISTDLEDFHKWRNFMEKTNLTLEQDLWREQRSNPAIRRYLKERPTFKAMKV